MNSDSEMIAGKRRQVANPATKKEKDQPKPGLSVTESKPKRAFGRNLSGNTTVDRPSQKPLAAKPWKPSGVSKNTQKPLKKVSTALSCAGVAKSGSNKKVHHVTFLETRLPAAVDGSIEASCDDLLVCTPVLSIDPLMQETPYQSAENCSKCRLERLESSSYWISQVKVAETSGKHFVSAAFFRLALECDAQPFVSLQNELKHYRDRHGVVFMESLWDDLCRDYGLTSEQPDANSGDSDSIDAVLVEQFDSKCIVKEEGDCTDDRDMCLDYDIIEKPDEILEDLEAKKDGMLKLRSSMDSPLRNLQDLESPSSNSVLSCSASRSFKVAQKKSKFGDFTSNDSAGDTRTNKSIIYGKKVGQAWKKEAGTIMGSNDLLKSKSIAEEQCTSNHFDENVNLVDGRENQIFNKD